MIQDQLLLIWITIPICFLLIIIYLHFKFKKMSANLNEINAALDTAKATLQNVAADVASLHSQLGSIDAPTQAEWDATKAKVADLNSQLTTIDAETPGP